jgi:hypothetical protein
MFREIREARTLWRLRRRLNNSNRAWMHAKLQYRKNEIAKDALSAAQKQAEFARWNLQKYWSSILISKAERKGQEIPRKAGWWEDDSEDFKDIPRSESEDLISEWLTPAGIFGARRFFKEERRKTFEWWYTKVVIPTLQVAIPIIAVFLVYLSGKK